MAAPGKFSITPEFAQGLDYVLLACNHFHLKDVVQQPESDSAHDIAIHIISFFISGVRTGLATSIAHHFIPYGYLQQSDQAIATITDVEFLDTFGIASELGVGIEITVSFFFRLSPNRIPHLDHGGISKRRSEFSPLQNRRIAGLYLERMLTALQCKDVSPS